MGEMLVRVNRDERTSRGAEERRMLERARAGTGRTVRMLPARRITQLPVNDYESEDPGYRELTRGIKRQLEAAGYFATDRVFRRSVFQLGDLIIKQSRTEFGPPEPVRDGFPLPERNPFSRRVEWCLNELRRSGTLIEQSRGFKRVVNFAFDQIAILREPGFTLN